MRNTDLAWLAGIIDGEGSLVIFLRKNLSSSNREVITPSANLTITNTNRAIIEKCVGILVELDIKITLINPKLRAKRPQRRVNIRNYSSLEKLLVAVMPFLVGKTEQAALMLDFVRRASKRTAFRATDERHQYAVEMSRLNKLGQLIP
jgi:hypothetical protein